jgi:hypothetical protein
MLVRALHLIRQWAKALVARHGRALLVLSVGVVLIQAIVIAHRPPILGSPDGDEYLGVAANILAHGRIFDPLRTPGYPLLLALVLLARGGPDLVAVVAVQVVLTVAAAYELYALVFRLTGRPAHACAVALLVGANSFVLNWEFNIRAETLAYWVLVTLALVVERQLRNPRLTTLIWLGVLLLFEILVRPIDIFLPAVLLGGLAIRAVWMGRWREQGLRVAAAMVLVYACTVGYIALNHAATGYAGLSDASNVNLFGKVIEYHLQDLPVSPELTPVQHDSVQFAHNLGPDVSTMTGRPWEFARAHGYDRDFYEPVGAYGRYVALHYPQYYIPATLHEIVVDWLAPPVLYDPEARTIVSRVLDHASQLSLIAAYLALPLLACWLIWRLRHDPSDPTSFFLLLLAAAFAGLVVMAAVGCYDEATRLRSPLDWVPLAIAGILGLRAVEGLVAMRRRRSYADPLAAHVLATHVLAAHVKVGRRADTLSRTADDSEIPPRRDALDAPVHDRIDGTPSSM